MVQVLSGPVESFDMLLYPEQSAINQWYLQNQLNRFSQSLNDIGRQFMQGVTTLYDRVQNSDAIRKARAVLRSAEGLAHVNTIVPLESLEELQSANLIMQRWIMAQPDLRALYQKHLIEGYSDTYVDVHPDTRGDTHYDYRRVMDGIVQFDEHGWFVKQFIDDIYEGDRELYFEEKVDILKTWEIIEMALKQQQDPTNPFGGEIG